jgi:hypothetical protein
VAQSCVTVLLGLAGRPLPAYGTFLHGMPLNGLAQAWPRNSCGDG